MWNSGMKIQKNSWNMQKHFMEHLQSCVVCIPTESHTFPTTRGQLLMWNNLSAVLECKCNSIGICVAKKM